MEAWSPQFAATEENMVRKDIYRGPGKATVRSWPKKLLTHRSVNEKSIGFEHVPKSDSPCGFQACWSFPYEELLFAGTFFMEAWNPQLAPTCENDACNDIFNGSLKPFTCSYVRKWCLQGIFKWKGLKPSTCSYMRKWCLQGHFEGKPETFHLLLHEKMMLARPFKGKPETAKLLLHEKMMLARTF